MTLSELVEDVILVAAEEIFHHGGKWMPGGVHRAAWMVISAAENRQIRDWWALTAHKA